MQRAVLHCLSREVNFYISTLPQVGTHIVMNDPLSDGIPDMFLIFCIFFSPYCKVCENTFFCTTKAVKI